MAGLAPRWPAGLVVWLLLLGAAPSVAAQELPPFTLVSYNLRGGVDDRNAPAHPQALKVVAAQRPDLVILLEPGQLDPAAAARGLGLDHQHEFKAAYGDEAWRRGIMVLSRHPLRAPETLPLKGVEKTRRFGRLVVEMAGIPLSLYAVHLSREGLVDARGKGLIKEVLGGGERVPQAESLVAALQEDRHRYRLLAGDLNTFPLSAPYRLLADVLVDAFPTLFGEGTYRNREGLPDPKIDHIFLGGGVKASRAWVVKDGPSDHYPVAATLELPLPADRGLAPRRAALAQAVLAGRGFLPGNVEGNLDPATRRAVAQYQAQQGLLVDGELNQATLARLLEGS